MSSSRSNAVWPTPSSFQTNHYLITIEINQDHEVMEGKKIMFLQDVIFSFKQEMNFKILIATAEMAKNLIKDSKISRQKNSGTSIHI